MLSKKERESKEYILRKTDIFANMSDETEKMLAALDETVFSAGETIVDADDFDSFKGLGVLLSGKACVYAKGSDRSVLLLYISIGNY